MKKLLPHCLKKGRKGEKRGVWALWHKPMAPKKNKGKEKVRKPKEESHEHIDFHLSFESHGDVRSLILPLNGPKRGKKGNKP